MTIEVLYFTGCPHADAARTLVRRCVAALGIQASIIERDGDYPSPSVRIDGKDVMGEPAVSERSCRLDRPSESKVMAGLRRAAEGPR